jgi:hypothetical protein
MPFQPGQSGNPRGRPRVGESLAYLLREKFPPERVAAELERILGDPEATPAHRLAALQLVGDRAYGKPPAEIALTVERPLDALPPGWDAMTPAARQRYLAAAYPDPTDGEL